MQEVTIFWFRRDLRLTDNCGFHNALLSESPVLPFFVFDTEILNTLPQNDARVTFIYKTLSEMRRELISHGSSLLALHDKPLQAFKKLLSKYKIKAVYTNHDYESYARERDKKINDYLKPQGIEFQSFKDQVIHERNEIVKDDGRPYVVYTPFSRKWLTRYQEEENRSFPSEQFLENCLKTATPLPFPSLEEMGFVQSSVKVPDRDVSPKLIQAYEATRNFPAKDRTSRLGPHLRFGTVSVRKMVSKASNEENNTFLKELVWREFFMQILWHFPHTEHSSFKPRYDRIQWRNDEQDFRRWCEGTTGYPLVDAGMRQLNETGFMHNRVRMLVGSFLCKHLLIDWRWGEAYFAEKLLDYEMASNVGNWQWVAGCGVDAAPYFRIFNPTTQIQKFDKDLQYIKRWVPDFQELTYPTPIVDHKFARERCLRVYKEAVG